MNELQKIMNQIAEWSDKTFNSNIERRLGMIAHLRKEINELDRAISLNPEMEDLDVREEISDCLMLILDIAMHTGINADLLLFDLEYKLMKNKMRNWGNLNKDGSIEHI